MATPCGEGGMAWRLWGAGAPLLLLHGGSGSWTHWLRSIPALVDAGHLVCAPDLPGFGESAVPPGEPDADTSVGPLLAGLEQVLPGQAVDLAGFSFGSVVGSLAAVEAPQRFRRIVLFGAPILPLAMGRGVRLRPWRNLATPMLHSPEAIDETAVTLQELSVPRDRMPGRKLVTSDAVGRALRRLASPVWAAYGSEDVVFRDRWPAVEAAWREVPQLQDFIRFPQAGHWVQYERPEAVNALLLRAFAA